MLFIFTGLTRVVGGMFWILVIIVILLPGTLTVWVDAHIDDWTWYEP